MIDQKKQLEDLTDRLILASDRLLASVETKDPAQLNAQDSQIVERITKVTTILISRFENRKVGSVYEAVSLKDLEKEYENED